MYVNNVNVSFLFYIKGGANGLLKRKMKVITNDNMSIKMGFEVFFR